MDWPTTGGIRTSDYPLFLYLYNFEFAVDFEELIHLEGSNVYLSFIVHGGKDPTLNFVGDFQGVDNIEAYNLVQLAELWYQQEFINKKYSLTFGKIDAYATFPYTVYAQQLINNAYSQIPTIIPYPSYPNTAVGLVFTGDIKDWITVKASFFDGSVAQGVNTGNFGAKGFFQNLGKHILFLNEIDLMWRSKQDNYKGRATLGLWGFNGRLATLDGREMGKSIGPYFGASQLFWKEKEKKIKRSKPFKKSELGGFVQWGYANPRISGTVYYLSGGLTYLNVTKTFDGDTFSIGAATSFFSNAPGNPFVKSFETDLEVTYQLNIMPGFSIQPDLQWVINPGGNGNKNAFIVILRLSVSI